MPKIETAVKLFRLTHFRPDSTFSRANFRYVVWLSHLNNAPESRPALY
jgi:hypothetical protein